MLRDRRSVVEMFGLLCLLVGCPFLAHSFLDNYIYGETDLFTFVWWVPAMLVLLLLSPILPPSSRFSGRVALASWLALLLRTAFNSYVHPDFPLLRGSAGMYATYVIYGLLVGIPLLVVLFRRVAALGLLKLTVIVGFLAVLARYVVEASPGFDLALSTSDVVSEPDLARNVLEWLQNTDWVTHRLPVYSGLGYLLARNKGLGKATVFGILMAVVDTIVAESVMLWGVYQLPGSAHFVSKLDWKEQIILYLQWQLPQLIVLSVAALLGALVTLIPRSVAYRPRMRYVYPDKARRRPARQVAPGVEAG